MASSRVGATVRSARQRAGLSREALAYRSGLSCAAIAQIECGRRREVRLGTLLTLAKVLGVSIDYLVGNETTSVPKLLQHRVLMYESDDQYLASAVPFLQEGVARSEALLVVTASRQADMLRDVLGADADRVDFRNSVNWYTTPTASVERYRAFVAQQFERGATWIRVIGEPVWTGRTQAEMVEWTRYESIVNLSFALAPVTIMCPYDVRAISPQVLADARHTHPEVVEWGAVASSGAYREPEEFLVKLGQIGLSPWEDPALAKR